MTEVPTKFLPFDEVAEREMVKILESSPIYSHRGTSAWKAPTGFQWVQETIGVREHSFLVRSRDKKRVVEIPKYVVLVDSNDERLIFTSMQTLRPVVYVVPVSEMGSVGFTKSLDEFGISPVLDGEKLKKHSLPDVIVGLYRVRGEFFLWTWDSSVAELVHLPIRWFNDCQPDPVIESIEKVVYNPSRGVILGSGARIPHFVMSGSGKELVGFLRTYGDRLEREAFDRKIRVWSERIDGKKSAYLG